MTETRGFLDCGDGRRLAFERSAGHEPEIVFLGGYASDMTGSKALFLEAHARRLGQAFTRFDYRGHGQSPGVFEEHTISDWRDDALAIIDKVVQRSFVLVGSSMGGWLMLLAGLARKERLAGLVGIAAAPDFTQRLMEPGLSAEQRAELAGKGRILMPSAYGDPVPLRQASSTMAATNLLLGSTIEIDRPVHLLHGQLDPDVPWQTSVDLAAALRSPHVTVELVKDGDHRLSRDEDLRRIGHAVDRVLDAAL
ncbi:MAG: alpha/beta hydrolase [Geminicoccaceae bacterium]